MSNLTVQKEETSFLRKEILKKYSSVTGYIFTEFEKELTGTIGIYEKIADVICDYIENENNLSKYTDFIKESPFKIQLRKFKEGRDEEKRKFLRDLRSFVSGNVVRKLIFYGPNENNMTFKEDFIKACYFYVHKDRLLFLQNKPVKIKAVNANTTIPAILISDSNPGNATLPVFDKEPAFILKHLKDTNEIDSEKKILEFQGKSNFLNRSNLDPDNLTITSKVQAEINYINGQWYLENKSALGTTFILVNKPTKIAKGDIIVLGNKKFFFDDP
jgi:hypothetical protein